MKEYNIHPEDYLGCSFEVMAEYYHGKKYDEVLADLNYMFPEEDNCDLAESIYNSIK